MNLGCAVERQPTNQVGACMQIDANAAEGAESTLANSTDPSPSTFDITRECIMLSTDALAVIGMGVNAMFE
jgi:hypothetical protein